MRAKWVSIRSGFLTLESAEAAAAALKRDLPRQRVQTRVIGSPSTGRGYTLQAREEQR